MASKQDKALEKLRGYLYSEPSLKGFELILKTIKKALHAQKTKEQGQVMLSYALGALEEGWPDSLRVVSGEQAQSLCQQPQEWGPLVRFVDFSWSSMEEDEFQAITRQEHLEHLTGLLLFDVRIGAAGIEALTQGSKLRGLQHLHLGQNDLCDQDIAALANSALMKSLCTLSLQINELSDSSLEALASTQNSAQLQHLNLNSTQITSTGIRALSKASHLQQLRILEIGDCGNLEDKDLSALFTAPQIKGFTHLNLSGNKLITLSWLKTLGESHHAQSLRAMRLSDCGVGWAPENMEQLGVFQALKVLDLGLNDLESNLEVSALAKLPHLRHLDLQYNRLMCEGTTTLANTPGWPALQTLDLYENRIQDKGAQALANSALVQQLSTLGVGYNKISKTALGQLKTQCSGKVVRKQIQGDEEKWAHCVI